MSFEELNVPENHIYLFKPQHTKLICIFPISNSKNDIISAWHS